MTVVLSVSKSPSALWKMPLHTNELESAFPAMLAVAGVSAAAVDLALLDDRDMESLHARSLGCAGPTNILAFPDNVSLPLPDGARFLGSLALSVDTLERECFLYGQNPDEHCIRLLAHGLAHLLGHDHGPAMSALCRRMEDAALAVRRKI